MEFFLKRVSICGVHDSSLLEYNYITHILILASIILQTQLPIHQYQMSHHIQTLIYTQKKKKKKTENSKTAKTEMEIGKR